ncbi:MAG: type II secretion system F family protein [Gammaproteobacteria bacterium]|nr:type II secretion system F family protein [Gammaproteobacteria bacterium]
MENSLIVIVAVLVGLVAIGAFGAGALRTRSRVRRRMGLFADMLQVEEAGAAAVPEAQEGVGAPRSPLVATLERRYPLSGGVRTTVIGVGAAVVAGAALVPLLSFFGLSGPLAVLLALAIGAAFGWSVGLMLETAKRNAFNDRFLPAIEDFQRMVYFGIATGQAFSSITAAAEEPLAGSLRNIQLQVEFGVPLAAAMEREARRVRVSELAMLSAIMGTQARTGGNLSEAVANLAEMLRERLDNRARIKASTAESRVTLIILSAVPVLAVAIQAALQPALVDVLLGEARHLLGMGAGLIVSGLVVSWLMIRSAQR